MFMPIDIDSIVKDISKVYPRANESDIKQNVIQSFTEVQKLKDLPGIQAAQEVHKISQDALDFCKSEYGDTYKRIACGKNCSECCKMAVAITDSEAELLIHGAKQNKVRIDLERLKAQKSFNLGDWHTLHKDRRHCVFLKNNQCSVYDYRPHACRYHFKLDNAKECNILKYPDKSFAYWLPVEMYVISIAITILGNTDYMPVKLLDHLGGSK